MSIMQKALNLFKLPDTTSSATTVQSTAASTYTPNPKMEQYYKRESHKKENNLNITYQDVAIYDMNPFDLKAPFISDGNFVCIALSDHNLDLAYNYLHAANNLIKPFQKYYKDSILPNILKTDTVYNRELPVSHLRLTPYTFQPCVNANPHSIYGYKILIIMDICIFTNSTLTNMENGKKGTYPLIVIIQLSPINFKSVMTDIKIMYVA